MSVIDYLNKRINSISKCFNKIFIYEEYILITYDNIVKVKDILTNPHQSPYKINDSFANLIIPHRIMMNMYQEYSKNVLGVRIKFKESEWVDKNVYIQGIPNSNIFKILAELQCEFPNKIVIIKREDVELDIKELLNEKGISYDENPIYLLVKS